MHKPGSVFDYHLSGHLITQALKQLRHFEIAGHYGLKVYLILAPSAGFT